MSLELLMRFPMLSLVNSSIVSMPSPHRLPWRAYPVWPTCGTSLLMFARPFQASLSPRSWASYSCMWEKWVHVSGGVISISSSRERRVASFSYLIYLLKKGSSGSSISSAMSALSFGFQLLGWEDITPAFPIRRVLQGCMHAISGVQFPPIFSPVSFPCCRSFVFPHSRPCGPPVRCGTGCGGELVSY